MVWTNWDLGKWPYYRVNRYCTSVQLVQIHMHAHARTHPRTHTHTHTHTHTRTHVHTHTHSYFNISVCFSQHFLLKRSRGVSLEEPNVQVMEVWFNGGSLHY